MKMKLCYYYFLSRKHLILQKENYFILSSNNNYLYNSRSITFSDIRTILSFKTLSMVFFMCLVSIDE